MALHGFRNPLHKAKLLQAYAYVHGYTHAPNMRVGCEWKDFPPRAARASPCGGRFEYEADDFKYTYDISLEEFQERVDEEFELHSKFEEFEKDQKVILFCIGIFIGLY